jgi:hypothetical protein
MEESIINFQQQLEKATSKRKCGVFGWAVIKSHKILIVALLIISASMSLSSLILLEPCHGDMGCIVLIPFYAASLPVLPVLLLVSGILDKITLPYYTFYGMPSILKFFPAIFLSTTAFLVGYIVIHLFLRLRKNKIGIENYRDSIHWARKNFIFYNIIFIILFSSYIFVQAPPAPFASDSMIVKSCRSYEECYQNYIHSKVKTCDGEKIMFVYPLKTTFLPTDRCVFDSFSEKKLLENISVSHGSGGGTIITYGKQGTTVSSPTYQMDILFKIFLDRIGEASIVQKENFCGAFSDEIQSKYITGNISNKEYCIQKLGLLPSNESNLVNLCNMALAREGWTQSELQKKCISKFANFQTYDPSPSIYDDFFGSGWQYISFQSGGAIYESWGRRDDGSFEMVYRLNVRKRYADSGEFDDLRISQGSVGGLFYNDFLDLKITQKEIKTTGSPEERISVKEETIQNSKILVERRVQHQNTGDRFYNIFHFVKNGTYIQLDSEFIYYLDSKKVDSMFRMIVEDILGGELE